jgi:hypothetical protein
VNVSPLLSFAFFILFAVETPGRQFCGFRAQESLRQRMRGNIASSPVICPLELLEAYD